MAIAAACGGRTTRDEPLPDPCDFDADGARGCGGPDCEDGDETIHPGVVDAAGDGIDSNCDDVDGIDTDRDGHASIASGGDDCDDDDPAIHPGAVDGIAWAWETVGDEEAWFPSAAIDGDGVAHVLYETESVAGEVSLRHATDASGGWTSETLPVQTGGREPRMALDSSSWVHVAFANGAGEVWHVTNASGTWLADLVDANASATTSVDVAIGPADLVEVLYTRSDGAVIVSSLSGGGWEAEVVRGFGSAGRFVVDSEGRRHVLSSDEDGLEYSTDASGAWTRELVDERGYVPSIAVAPDGSVWVAYVDAVDLRVASKAGGGWTVETIRDWWTPDFTVALAVDGVGRPHVAYGDRTHFSVHYTTREDGTWGSLEVAEGVGSAVVLDRDGSVFLAIAGTSLRWGRPLPPDEIDDDCDGGPT